MSVEIQIGAFFSCPHEATHGSVALREGLSLTCYPACGVGDADAMFAAVYSEIEGRDDTVAGYETRRVR